MRKCLIVNDLRRLQLLDSQQLINALISLILYLLSIYQNFGHIYSIYPIYGVYRDISIVKPFISLIGA